MTVLGVPELLARFARTAALGEVAQHTAQEHLSDDVASVARALVPVDTGTLRDSITGTADRVYTDVDYAAFVEYGTSTNPAQPYMRPAADTANTEGAAAAAAAVMRTA